MLEYFNKAINQRKNEATEKRFEAIQVEIRFEKAKIAQYIAHLITSFFLFKNHNLGKLVLGKKVSSIQQI